MFRLIGFVVVACLSGAPPTSAVADVIIQYNEYSGSPTIMKEWSSGNSPNLICISYSNQTHTLSTKLSTTRFSALPHHCK